MTLTERLTSDWATREASGVLFPTYLKEWPGYSERLLTESRPWVNFQLPLRDEDMRYRSDVEEE